MSSIISEIYRFRTLFFGLVRRHLATRYRGSALGFFWTFLNPLCLIAVYWLVFRFYIRFTTVENYTVFMFAGLLPWMWTTQALLEGTASISGSGHLITKSLFPAHLLPGVAVTTALVNFLLSLPILVGLMFLTDVPLRITFLFVPFYVILHFFLLYGITLMLSSLNVFYRDVQHVLGNGLTLLFFLCPIVYPESVVPERFKWTINYNPFAALITLYQRAILDGGAPDLKLIASVSVAALFCVLLGSFTYHRFREHFAEAL